MPVTSTTINRQQRDGLYELVRNDLGSVGDLFDALETEKDYGAAERLGIEFGEDFRLLQDLGWRPEEARETFELTMPPHDLMEVLQRLRGDAEKLLRESPAERQAREEDEATNERFRVGRDACTALLSDLDPREEKRPRPSASDLVIAERDEERPRPTLTIGASERNILYRLMVHRLYVLGDRPDEPQGSSGDLYRDFAEDVELIENLCWLDGNDHGHGVDLHMPPVKLAETLTRLREVARRASTETRLGLDSKKTVDRRQGWFRDAICTCDELLGPEALLHVIDVEPVSRVPERRALLAPYSADRGDRRRTLRDSLLEPLSHYGYQQRCSDTQDSHQGNPKRNECSPSSQFTVKLLQGTSV